MTIVFYAPGGPPYPWNARSIDDGIGGSEEALVYLSRELTSLGYRVFVFNRGPHGRCLLSDGFWLDIEKHDPRIAVPSADIFVSWRNWHVYDKAPEGAKKFLWLHDVGVEPHYSPEALSHFDKIIVLNKYHQSICKVPDEKAFVAGNGVSLDQFDQEAERVPGKCVYLSHPHRGLNELRRYWPQIKEAVPEATLHAFWWQKEFFLPPDEKLGIQPMKSLGHRELAREILSSQVFSYPSVFHPEICPISCIKAQVGGAWPVTVNCGGMSDTLIPEFSNTGTHEDFAERLIATLKMGIAETERQKMMAAAREKFNWRIIAQKWSDEFEGVING